MPNYTVIINYPHRRSETESGITVDYRKETLKLFDSKEEAFRFARYQQFRLKPQETIYIIEKSRDSERTIHYIAANKEGSIE